MADPSCILRYFTLLAIVTPAWTTTLSDCPSSVPRDSRLHVYQHACYQFILESQLDYPDAAGDCRSKGGTLALPKSRHENQWLVGLLVHTFQYTDLVWIGLNDEVTEDIYVWEDGSLLKPGDFHNWAPGGLLSSVDDCVLLDPPSGGQWVDYPCRSHLFGLLSSSKSYVCQFGVQSGPALPTQGVTQGVIPVTPAWTTTLSDCPSIVPRDSRLHVYRNACYQFMLNKDLDYPDAAGDCLSKGGTLALPKSRHENQWIVGLLVHTFQYTERVWIGLNDQRIEGTFVWEDGSLLKPGDFHNWSPGGLLSSVDDCVLLDPPSGGQWVDYTCESHLFGFLSSKNAYVCQYNAKFNEQSIVG